MKVILKEDVKDLGTIGSIVDVAPGYGRNYLIPRNLAVEATSKNIRYFEHQKKLILAKAKKIRQSAEDVARSLSEVTLTIGALAGEEDKLFGSVTSRDIADELSKKGFEFDRRKIILDEPIKKLGIHEVQVKLHQDVTATVRVEVVKTESE
jgi:large subunit ribosomal protein L9